MASTPLLKSENIDRGFSHKFLIGFILLVFTTANLVFFASIYNQQRHHSHQIGSLVSQIEIQSSYQQELLTRIQHLERNVPEIEEALRKTDHEFSQSLQSLIHDVKHNDALLKDEQTSVLDRVIKNEETLDQLKDSLSQYVKSKDFFEIINNMVETYTKKFDKISQDFNEKNKIIQDLLQAAQLNNQPSIVFDDKEIFEDSDVKVDSERENEESFIDIVGESLGGLKAKISDGAEKTFEKIKDLTKSTQEKFEPVKNFIVNNAAESVKIVTENQPEASLEKIKEFFNSTGESLKGVKDQSAEKIKEFSKKAAEKMEPIKDVVSEKVQHMKEGVQNFGKDLGEKTKNLAGKAKDYLKNKLF